MSSGFDICLSIEGWSAWTNHGSFAGQWPDLLSSPPRPDGGKVADVSFLAPGARRRLKPMARAALYTATQAIGSCGWSDVPLVLFSEHGEAHRGLRIMTDMANGEPVSPAEFSHSVHNAVAGQLSILTGNTNAVIAVADSGEGVGGALLEAYLMLCNPQYQHAMVVCYDEPLPELYADYCESPCALLAVAVLLGTGGRGRSLQGRRRCEPNGTAEAAWRQMIRLAHCLETGAGVVMENAVSRWELDVLASEG